MTKRHARRGLITGAASIGLVVAVSACRPVIGNLNDRTPPVITFTVNGNVVPNGGSYDVFGVGYQVIITASDRGGVESLETAIENHFTCTANGTSIAETDTNPATLKGYDYLISDHAYFAHRTTPDDFWPDVNVNNVKDPAERKLRYNQLIVIDDASLLQQSFDTYATGSDCLMADGTTHGTVSDDRLVVTATAKNTRSEIASAPTTQSTTSRQIELA